MPTLQFVNDVIRDAKYHLTLWTEEYNVHGPKASRRSSMKKSDLTWLEKKIKRLETFRESVISEARDISEEIRARHN